jgi:hypothetical protein
MVGTLFNGKSLIGVISAKTLVHHRRLTQFGLSDFCLPGDSEKHPEKHPEAHSEELKHSEQQAEAPFPVSASASS